MRGWSPAAESECLGDVKSLFVDIGDPTTLSRSPPWSLAMSEFFLFGDLVVLLLLPDL